MVFRLVTANVNLKLIKMKYCIITHSCKLGLRGKESKIWRKEMIYFAIQAKQKYL